MLFGAASVQFDFLAMLRFISPSPQDFLLHPRQSLVSLLKSLGFIPVVALHFLHGDLVTSQASVYCSFVASPLMNSCLILSTDFS